MSADRAPVYLDNAATTRVAPEVREAMAPHLDAQYGNPATLYTLGDRAARAVERAREQVCALVHAQAPEEVAFTSGGTESDNWALVGSVLRADKRHIVTSAVEHHAVLETCAYLQARGLAQVTVLPVDGAGLVDPQAVRDALREDTALVSIMHANNEIGTVQPIRALAEAAHERGVPLHIDAVQTVGKAPVDMQELGADMLSLSAHKFHGPKGVGALVVRAGTRLDPYLHGGGQEQGRRAGTLNVPGIVGLGAAAALATPEVLAHEDARLRALVDRLWQGIEARIPQVTRNGHPEQCLPGLLSVCVAGAEGEALLLYLSQRHDVCVSSGSACTTGSLDPSHVLLAIGRSTELAHGSLRFSLSRYTTDEEIDRVLDALPAEVERVRAMSPTWKG